MYSPHEVTNEERQTMEKLFLQFHSSVKKSRKGIKKLRFIIRYQ